MVYKVFGCLWHTYLSLLYTPSEKNNEDTLIVFSDTLLRIRKMQRFKKMEGQELTIQSMEVCGLSVLCVVGGWSY